MEDLITINDNTSMNKSISANYDHPHDYRQSLN